MTFDPFTGAFAPDSSLVADIRPSPHHGERRERWAETGPDLLLLHYTGMPAGRGMSAAERAIRWLTHPASEVSAHYVVGEDGRITQLVPESRRAWHAGRSSWAGESDVNSASIGIEIANPGHWWDLAGLPDRDPAVPVEVHPGYSDFPDVQIAAVIALARDIVARHGIRPERVLGHSDVAPGRKRDPGEKFPWDRLAAAGVGVVVEPAPVGSGVGRDLAIGEVGRVLAIGEASPAVAAMQVLLSRLGYGIVVDGVFGPKTGDVVEAFQRRWRREKVDGIADRSTLLTLHRLVTRGAPGGEGEGEA